MKAKTYLGIEIGNLQMKLVVCAEDKIKQVIVERLPDNLVREGEIVSWEVMGDFIKKKLKEHRISCKDAAVVIPEEMTYVRRFFMPYMTVEQMKINLPYEFRDFIIEEKDTYLYDYAVMDILEEEHNGMIQKSMDIMAVAILKETIEKYRSMLKHCGLRLRVAAPEVCAYQNIVRRHMKLQGEEVRDYAILDIGHDTVDLRIFKEGKYETGREIQIGLKALTYAIGDIFHVDEHIAELYKLNNQNNVLCYEECMTIYNNIEVEVRRVINFFTYNYPDNTLDTLYVCGGGTKIEPLMETLKSSSELKVRGLHELFEETIEDEEAIVLASMAIGMTWN